MVYSARSITAFALKLLNTIKRIKDSLLTVISIITLIQRIDLNFPVLVSLYSFILQSLFGNLSRLYFDKLIF